MAPLPPSVFRVPDTLNTLLTVGVVSLLLSLLWLGARVQSGWALALCVGAFTLLFQTQFALLHEATHLKLHSSPTWNRWLGVACGLLFPISFSLLSITHWSHHLKNRSDMEMFDLYYPHESRRKKAVGWYGMLLGLWYWVIPPCLLLLLLAPGTFRRASERLRIAEAIFHHEEITVGRMRAELLLCALVLGGVTWLSGLSLGRLGLFYAVAGMVWSGTNYLEHSYAPRHVIEGAFNLHAPVYGWLNLHRELDLNHHRHPDVPWLHLPALSAPGELRRGYLGHYLSQWLGPRPTFEPGPEPLKEIPRETPSCASS